jgi:hypothetical protein
MTGEQEKLLAAFAAWMDSQDGKVTLEQTFIEGALYGISTAKAAYSQISREPMPLEKVKP